LPPKPANARERGIARLRKEFVLKPEFKELWERIKYRTRYAVKIDTDKLIADVVLELDKAAIAAPQVTITKVQVEVGSDDVLDTKQIGWNKTPTDLTGRTLPNIIDIMDNLMEYTTPPVSLTRSTLLDIFQRASNKKAALANPYAFATEAVSMNGTK
jgi:type III restriction enzyme